MFLHIGKNSVIINKDLIGIFDIDKLNKSIYNDLKESHDIIDISENDKKTLVLLEIKGYITNISSLTLSKRIKF